jgi:GNAT superfamily N-acetyltransferase
MLENIEIKELSFNDINNDLLDNFNRYQKVDKYWHNENGNWSLINEGYIVDWDKNQKNDVIKLFSNIITEGEGYVFGVYENTNLIGFPVLLNKEFGTNNQYVQLKYLYISFGYRHKGIGKILFKLCVNKAKEIGAEKIYISATSSEDSQKFYLGIGCKDAIEINKEFAEAEPYDRQMEYVL